MSHSIRFLVLSLAIAGAVTLGYAQVDGEREMKQGDHSISGEVLPGSGVAPTTILISSRKPGGLILSEANLYFTSHDAAGAAVWRTAQTSTPGQERVLYWEQGAIFGDIVFAKVDGTFFGYFFATKARVTTIRRVPLAGGTATVLATVTSLDVEKNHGNLVTDGVSLFWQDERAVRKMPIRGGAITVLDRTALNKPTAGVSLSVNNLIYASENRIHFVPKSGAATTGPSLRIIVTASSRVTAFEPVANGIYWGEETGAVRLKVGSIITTIGTFPGEPTSISTNGFTAGANVAWTQCLPQSCRLHFDFPAVHGSSMAIGGDGLGVNATSAGKFFWGDAAGVHRF